MSQERSTSDLVLDGDSLDRGEYALTLFKIIAAYSPKKLYEFIDTIDLGPINQEKSTLSEITKEEARILQEPINKEHEPTPDTDTKTTSSDVDYTIKLQQLDNAAFIMSISGAWGTGKTTFVEMFEKTASQPRNHPHKRQSQRDNQRRNHLQGR